MAVYIYYLGKCKVVFHLISLFPPKYRITNFPICSNFLYIGKSKFFKNPFVLMNIALVSYHVLFEPLGRWLRGDCPVF